MSVESNRRMRKEESVGHVLYVYNSRECSFHAALLFLSFLLAAIALIFHKTTKGGHVPKISCASMASAEFSSSSSSRHSLVECPAEAS